MAIAIGGSAKGRGDGTSIATSAITTQATGSTFVIDLIWWEGGAGTFSGVADNKGNTYTLQGSQVSFGTNGGRARRYICVNGAGGSNHIATITATGGAVGMLIFLTEVTGGLTSGIVDQNNARADSASPYTLASGLTTTQADELLLSFLAGESASNPATHAETGLGGGSIILTETDGSQYWTGAVAARVVSSTGTYNPSWTEAGGTAAAVFLTTFKAAGGGGSPATLSSGTPSGTIATATTAAIGATTDQTSGTFYVVVDTSGNLSGVSASQVKAGQRASGASALASGNVSVSNTSPSVGVTGLSAATAYAYAAVQNNGDGDSNVLTGTFTTATLATLSSATPSGTIGTTTTATLGATTDQNTGTLYAVVDTAGNITGISASQVKAGQNNAGAAPVASGDATVSTTGPSVGVTGLTADTAYGFALVQTNTAGDSNVLTGSFTTAAVANPQNRVYGVQGFAKTLLTM